MTTTPASVRPTTPRCCGRGRPPRRSPMRARGTPRAGPPRTRLAHQGVVPVGPHPPRSLEDLRLGPGDGLDRAKALQVHWAHRGDDADAGGDPAAQVGDLAGAEGAPLGDGHLYPRVEALVDRPSP